MDKPVLDVTLPIEITNGNQGRGYHWRHKHGLRKAYEAELRHWGLVRVPFDFPVQLRITRILGPRQSHWDADSVGRGSYKELQDAMVACGWFHDDSFKWIRHVDYRQDDNHRDYGPGIRVEIFAVESARSDDPGEDPR